MFLYCKRYITVAALAAVAVAPAMAAPPEVPEGMLAVVVVGDVPGFIESAGTLGSKVVPMISAQSAKQMLGQQIGDPQLEALPKGSGAVVMFSGSNQPFGFLETAAGKAETVATNLKSRTGMSTKAVKDTLVAIAPTDSVLETAQAASASAEKLLQGDGDASIQGNVQVARAVKKYGPQIEKVIADLPSKMKDASGDKAAVADMVPALADAMYQGVRKLDVLQLELTPSDKGLQTDVSIFPIGGVPAGTLEGPKGEDLLKLLPGTGAMRAYGTFDGAVYLKLIGDSATTGSAASFVNMMKSYAENLQDGVAYSLDQTKEGASGAMAMGVKDEPAGLKYLEDTVNAMTTGAVAEMLKAADVDSSSSLEKNVRQVDGVNVHKYTVSVEVPNAGASANMGAGAYEVAVVDGKMLMAAGDIKIESLISAAKAGSNTAAKELEAPGELESGGVMYGDYNVGKIMASGAGIPEGFNDLPSIYLGAYQDADAVKMSILVPTAFFQEIPHVMSKMKEQSESTTESETSSDDNESTGSTSGSSNSSSSVE